MSLCLVNYFLLKTIFEKRKKVIGEKLIDRRSFYRFFVDEEEIEIPMI